MSARERSEITRRAEGPRPSPRRSPWIPANAAPWYVLAALLAATVLSMHWVDAPLALYLNAWRKPENIPRLLRDVLTRAEVFGHAWGAVAVLVAYFVVRPDRRRRLPRCAACVFGAGLLAALAKLLIARWRPHTLRLAALSLSTFGPWLPPRLTSDFQSFPSGHTASAVALAIALTWLMPRGRWLFLFFAVLVACQRVLFLVHYVSDVTAGALVACLWCRLCFNANLMGGLFDVLERRRPKSALASEQQQTKAA